MFHLLVALAATLTVVCSARSQDPTVDPAPPVAGAPDEDPAEDLEQQRLLAAHVVGLGNAATREAATMALVRAGAAGAQAVAHLLSSGAEMDEDAAGAACRVLESIGLPAVPYLPAVVERFYRADAAPIRPRLLKTLGRLGVFDHATRDQWLAKLKSLARGESPLSMDGFFPAIGAMQAPGRGSPSQLILTLGKSDPLPLAGAARAIGYRVEEWSPAERTALENALVQCLGRTLPSKFNVTWMWGASQARTSGSLQKRDRDALRRSLCWALARLDPGHELAGPGLVEDFCHGDPAVAVRAIQMVATPSGTVDGEVVAGLIEVLGGGRPRLAWEAATALGIVGRSHPQVRGALATAAAQDRDEQLALRARAALRALDK